MSRDSEPFCANVVWIKNRNITLGCAPGLYCPNDNVSRLTMAAFLNRLGDAVLPPKVLWVANVGGTFDSIQAAIDYAVAQGVAVAFTLGQALFVFLLTWFVLSELLLERAGSPPT